MAPPVRDPFYRARECVSTHDTWVIDGEEQVEQILKRLRIPYQHEGRSYPLRYRLPDGRLREGAFCPDFYLPPHQGRPALNVEITFADHGRPEMSRAGYRANQDRVQTKRQKIGLTREHYEIETVLITKSIFLEIQRDVRHFEYLIRQAARRHVRNGRRLAKAS